MPHPQETPGGIQQAVESGWYKLFGSKSSEMVVCALAINGHSTANEITQMVHGTGNRQAGLRNPIRRLHQLGIIGASGRAYQVNQEATGFLLDHFPYKHARISRALIGLGLDREEAERRLSEDSANLRQYEANQHITTGRQEETWLGLAISLTDSTTSTVREISGITGFPESTTQKNLVTLEEAGLVRAAKEGSGKSHKTHGYYFDGPGKEQTITYFLGEAQLFGNVIGTLIDGLE